MKTLNKSNSERVSPFIILYIVIIILIFGLSSNQANAATPVIITSDAAAAMPATGGESINLTIEVYSNAVSGKLLTAEFGEILTDEKVQVTIYNMTGQLLYNEIYTVKSNHPTYEINLDKLGNSGMIILRAKSASKSITKKVVL